MKGIAENDLGACAMKPIGRHGLDHTVTTHRHELRCVECAVVKHEAAATRLALRVVDREFKHGHIVSECQAMPGVAERIAWVTVQGHVTMAFRAPYPGGCAISGACL